MHEFDPEYILEKPGINTCKLRRFFISSVVLEMRGRDEEWALDIR
jgi:hypothetical protein